MKTKIFISKNVSMDEQELAVTEKRIIQAVDRFNSHLKDIQVSFHDINGEKGGDNDKECKVIARFYNSGAEDIIVTSNKSKMAEAVTDCAHRLKERISKRLSKVRNTSKVSLKEISSLSSAI